MHKKTDDDSVTPLKRRRHRTKSSLHVLKFAFNKTRKFANWLVFGPPRKSTQVRPQNWKAAPRPASRAQSLFRYRVLRQFAFGQISSFILQMQNGLPTAPQLFRTYQCNFPQIDPRKTQNNSDRHQNHILVSNNVPQPNSGDSKKVWSVLWEQMSSRNFPYFINGQIAGRIYPGLPNRWH